ncbi:tetratricopeptide repeat protein [Streptomyces spectabilis]|uniref:tetratricopeptide repeat protein n=1 Tax=Streptomyces spectabilis TaxID=68270 RepID=UPI001CEF71B4|nr:tetratricopeptide repeat protein [Streptomyces spectabilis]
MADATTWQERLALTATFLTRRAAPAPAMAPEVATAWETIVRSSGRVRVADLTASRGWSRKKLWSRFNDRIGLTPKHAAILVRFDRAAHAPSAGENLSGTALACGYVDQLHPYRDVQALAGRGPVRPHRQASEYGHLSEAASTLDSLGCIAHHTGRRQQAVEYYEQALPLFRGYADSSNEADTLANLAETHRTLGNEGPARAAWQQALALYEAQSREGQTERVRSLPPQGPS